MHVLNYHTQLRAQKVALYIVLNNQALDLVQKFLCSMQCHLESRMGKGTKGRVSSEEASLGYIPFMFIPPLESISENRGFSTPPRKTKSLL